MPESDPKSGLVCYTSVPVSETISSDGIGYGILIELPPPPKWRVTFLEDSFEFETKKDASWWFRFWTKFFFGAKWIRL